MVFEVKTADEGIHKICVQEEKQQLSEKAMSALYGLRIDVFDMVGPDQKVNIRCYIIGRQYNIKVKGARDEDDELKIHISAEGCITHKRIFGKRFPDGVIPITENKTPDEGIHKILKTYGFSKEVKEKLKQLRTDLLKKLHGEENVQIIVDVDDMRFNVIVNEGRFRLNVNITYSKYEIVVQSSAEILVKCVEWIPGFPWSRTIVFSFSEYISWAIITIFNAVSKLPVHVVEFVKWLFERQSKKEK